MDANIREKLVTALDGVNDITGGIHYMRTEETPGTPYVVFFEFAGNSYRDTVDVYEETFVQFSCFDKAVNPIAIETIANNIYNALDGSSLSLTNYECLSLLGWRRPFAQVTDDQYWQMILEVRLKLQKK